MGCRIGNRMEAHVDTDVRRHIRKGGSETQSYEVSAEHLETNLHMICTAVSLATTDMIPPHLGQVQDEAVRAISAERVTGAIPSR